MTTTVTAGLRLVPFHEQWITHDKLDLHAIYRRPRFVEDEFGELVREVDANGAPTWDITGPLPVKAHNKWRAKGFEYVTLADRSSLNKAARANTLLHPDGTLARATDYEQHQVGGPWNWRLYAKGREATRTLETEQLAADVHEYGSAAVEAIRRRMDPGFTLPVHLQSVPPRPQIVTATVADEAEVELKVGKPRKGDTA